MKRVICKLIRFAALRVNDTNAQIALAALFGMVELFGVKRSITLVTIVYRENKRNARR